MDDYSTFAAKDIAQAINETARKLALFVDQDMQMRRKLARQLTALGLTICGAFVILLFKYIQERRKGDR